MATDDRETITGGSIYHQNGYIFKQHVQRSDGALFYHNLSSVIDFLRYKDIYTHDPPKMWPTKLIYIHDELEANIRSANEVVGRRPCECTLPVPIVWPI
jgi:hypothetical protein